MNNRMRAQRERFDRITKYGRLDGRSRLARARHSRCRDCGIILDESECTPEASDLCESCAYRRRTGKMLIRGTDFTQGYLMRESLSVDRKTSARNEYVQRYHARRAAERRKYTKREPVKEMA